ncbi:hypothetical protein MBVG596_1010 [Mycoplasmopsis bovigenitalium]|uniref:DUF2179 domain-containing protein n=1 Tax=Mycoplasmopsis bovigenitalium TaxID=2112 RepID=UPI00090AC6F8|nr:DUF2179 domain-containing protein [Mycoplasmopsis bovigenitalium]BAW18518.1 hypothetical protein MBVG596_1010 [Mycoplasmopsis bovigenitalium]
MNKQQYTQSREIEIKKNRVKQSFLHFSSLYRITKLKWQILSSIIVGILFGVVEFTFLQNTGIYSLGIGAIGQGIARFVRIWNKNDVLFDAIFWIFNFAGNIPLFIFAYYKITKRFALLNLVYMISTTITGFVCASIPGSENLFIFSDPNTVILENNINVLKEVNIVLWEHGNFQQLSIFFYAIIFGILQAIFNAILLITESSSAGFDIYAVYLARKKFKDLGTVFLILHLICLLFSNIFGTYIPASFELLKTQDNRKLAWAMRTFFSPTFIAGVMMIVVNGIALNTFFPKFTMVRVEIMSSKINEIQQEIQNAKGKAFVTTLLNARGGYSKKSQEVLITNCLFIDTAFLLDLAHKIDENAFVTVIDVKKVDGHVYTADVKDRKTRKSKTTSIKKANNNSLNNL